MSREDAGTVPSPLFRFLASHGTLTWILLALGIVIILCILIVTPGCSEPAAKSAPADASAGSVTTREKGPIDQETVERIVERKLGDLATGGDPIIRSLELVPEPEGFFISLELNRPESCHPGQLVATAADMSSSMMSTLFRYPNVSRVQVTLYGTTKDVADKDKKAASFTVDRGRALTMDWFEFTDVNVERLATAFWIEPTIYANWKTYGGQAINDENARAAANTTGGATP